ncbi:AraC family transcriptional regulator [Marinobacter sp. P4B1]|uniref:AraC family transcriptional regulator n=2 Tax=Marinobacter TaxID=2742 RepID=UPI00071C894E|nr:AraC family transcriptional regulator [Marinobacter sp. P4B1]KRW80711.1 hypothetical protein AQ621_00720 [Marinobacter sp. P4B1]
MSYFDEYRRGITSARLMVDYFQAQGASVTRLLAGTGLAVGDLNDPNTDILARQELRLVANILAQVPDAQSQAAALGNRYHFSAYGLWGYGLVCCNTAAQALSLALNYLPLTYAFSGIGYREEGDKGFLCFTPPPLEPEVSQFVLARDMVAAALLVRELLEQYRNAEACRLLQQSDLTISDIALRLGFSDTSTFSQAFKRWQGVAPSVYRVPPPSF